MTSDLTGEIYVVQRTRPGELGVLPPDSPGGGNGGGGTTGGIGGENAAATGAVVPGTYEMFMLVGLSLTLSLVGGAF